MEELLKAILLASLPEKERAKMEEPVIISLKKEPGLNGEVITEINGPASSVLYLKLNRESLKEEDTKNACSKVG